MLLRTVTFGLLVLVLAMPVLEAQSLSDPDWMAASWLTA